MSCDPAGLADLHLAGEDLGPGLCRDYLLLQKRFSVQCDCLDLFTISWLHCYPESDLIEDYPKEDPVPSSMTHHLFYSASVPADTT
ncbi:hypothetical protein NDU88_009744 [Pleurodeles waltl]|uniref:Uncharacterized protein n=1 Tax=Pleurodeles waltl TaxID=8319 RepID=A0AAV7QYD6_PLEWA|nr:hypothetical protein NDU88_009744 [Pleurodeles waltl]